MILCVSNDIIKFIEEILFDTSLQKKCWHWQMKDSIDISKYFPTPNLWQCKYTIHHPNISFASSIDLFTIHAYLCAFFYCFLCDFFLSWWLWVTHFPYFVVVKKWYFFLVKSLVFTTLERWHWGRYQNINKPKSNGGFTSRLYNK